jgi:hypothetical protein
MIFLQQRERLGHAGRFDDLVAVDAAEQIHEKLALFGIVFDDEDGQ